MQVSKVWNGIVVRFKNGHTIDVRFVLHNWALPMSVYWINIGKDLEKDFGVQILCMSVEWSNNKPPF